MSQVPADTPLTREEPYYGRPVCVDDLHGGYEAHSVALVGFSRKGLQDLASAGVGDSASTELFFETADGALYRIVPAKEGEGATLTIVRGKEQETRQLPWQFMETARLKVGEPFEYEGTPVTRILTVNPSRIVFTETPEHVSDLRDRFTDALKGIQ